MMTQYLASPWPARALALALAALTFSAAQAQAPAAGAADTTVSDRIKKDAASPLYWIRLNAQKADAAGAKAAPRITEVRSAPRAAPAQATASPSPANPPVRSTTAVAIGLGVLPADGAAAREAAAPATASMAEASPPVAPSATPAGGLAGAVGAGLAAPSGQGAADAARTAAAEPPADDLDDQPLALVKAGEPEFPAHVMRKLRKGTVQVRFEVQADGSVANVSVLQTSHRGLNDAALGAVSAWRFQPVRSSRSAVVELGFDLDS